MLRYAWLLCSLLAGCASSAPSWTVMAPTTVYGAAPASGTINGNPVPSPGGNFNPVAGGWLNGL